MNDALKNGRAACAKRDHGHQQGKGEEHAFLGTQAKGRGSPRTIDTSATAGMVRPMLARADPRARFMLV